MKSIINALALAVILFAGTASGQEVKSGTTPLPTFKTFYTYSSTLHRNDISFTPVEGQMKGRLMLTGDQCFIDQEVSVTEESQAFIINFQGLTPKNPQDASAVAFCTAGHVKVTLHKKKGIFGYHGRLEGNFPGHSRLIGPFSY